MEREGYDGAAADGDEPGLIREAAPGARFDPTPYLRQLRGRGASGEYLDVKWRLLWLRTEHPDARIETEHVRIEPALAIFKATVSLPSGGVATGYGSETPGDFGDYIEKAETKAIGRALNALGYGAQFREPGDEEPSSTGAQGRSASDSGRAGGTAQRPPAVQRDAAPQAPPRPIELNAGRERPAAPSPAGDGGDGSFTWPAFREWVTGLGINSREEINQLVGRDTSSMGPAELRDAIIAARG